MSGVGTIRRAIGNAPWDYKTRNEGRAALRALEAELLQQADRIAWLEGDVAQRRIENQRLRDALERITRWDYSEGADNNAVRIARAALDGTPSAAQTLEDATPTERAEASSNG